MSCQLERPEELISELAIDGAVTAEGVCSNQTGSFDRILKRRLKWSE